MTTVATRFQGVIPPVCTPRTAEGAIDVPSLENLTRHLLDGGVTGLFVNGSSGEVTHLTNDERDTVLTTIAGVNAGQVPLLVGAVEQTTNRVVEEARRMVSLGADGIVATSQYYAISNAEETGRHIRTVAASVDVP
ncbi:dihydrodipicolinate synthase family protein, partial [Specibacter sp. AOP5-B1-6]|uniref:dihydrodipicolinate synthase family protein n=1 Tax=Specibacter sp. AOP5-B1-6 TaxID=3457653 RepID=UPI00402B345B